MTDGEDMTVASGFCLQSELGDVSKIIPGSEIKVTLVIKSSFPSDVVCDEVSLSLNYSEQTSPAAKATPLSLIHI